MINANELRLGNYVLLYNDTPVKISVIAKQVLQVDEGSGNVFSLQNVEPIPLTPEILQKAGFKEVQNTIYQSNKVFENRLIQLKQMGNEFIRVDINERCTTEYATVYKYVHQLQNLHFALELSELQIEL